MKNKKIIYIIVAFIILISIISIVVIKNRKQELNDHTPPEASSILDALRKKYPDKEYKKLKAGDVLTEDTLFSKYSFINNNSIYIFNPQKLDDFFHPKHFLQKTLLLFWASYANMSSMHQNDRAISFYLSQIRLPLL